MKLYGVVNIDMVGSRNMAQRGHVQEKLERYVASFNEQFSDILAAPAAITLGDEWQLVTHRPAESYNLFHLFQQLFWEDGIRLYAGIGIGELSTPVAEDTRKMDGPCYHAAREALKTAKGEGRTRTEARAKPESRTKPESRIRAGLSSSKQNRVFLIIHKDGMSAGNDILDAYMNAGVNPSAHPAFSDAIEEAAAASEPANSGGLHRERYLEHFMLERTINLLIENNEILKARMTAKQREAYISYFRLGSYRKMLADSEGIGGSIGGISQKLNSACYFTIQRNHGMVSLLLDSLRCGESDV